MTWQELPMSRHARRKLVSHARARHVTTWGTFTSRRSLMRHGGIGSSFWGTRSVWDSSHLGGRRRQVPADWLLLSACVANQALLPCSACTGPLGLPPTSLSFAPSGEDLLEPLSSTLQPLGGSCCVAPLRTRTQARRARRWRPSLGRGERAAPRRGSHGWPGRRALRGGCSRNRCGSAESALLLGKLELVLLPLLRQRKLLVVRQPALVSADELNHGSRRLVPGKA